MTGRDNVQENETASDELKPCPFCGGNAETITGPVSGRWGVRCLECDVWRDDRKATEAEAIAAWNRRAPPASYGVPVACDGYRLVPVAALKWLNGEGPDPAGVWFGDFPDDHPQPPGQYWWRSLFFAMIAHPAPVAGEPSDLVVKAEAERDALGDSLRNYATLERMAQERAEAAEARQDAQQTAISMLTDRAERAEADRDRLALELSQAKQLIERLTDAALSQDGETRELDAIVLDAINAKPEPFRAAIATALSAQEAEIERLKAKVERYEARLEIDHCYVMAESGDELERRDVPAEERETWPDGITCRDETIRLLEEQIAALPPKGEG